MPPPATHSEVTGGMPGWQVTLIAAGAALPAAALAALLDRAPDRPAAHDGTTA